MCIAPLTIKNPNAHIIGEQSSISVPCNGCHQCRKSKAFDWFIRLKMEMRNYFYMHFITLTYSDDTIPVTLYGEMTLESDHITAYFKRLREYTSMRLKYYAIGEYGGKTQRPHYHAIVFGVQDESLFAKAWRTRDVSGNLIPTGIVDVARVEDGSIGYVTGYAVKPRLSVAELGFRLPEFNRMSKGLGKGYLSPSMIAYHKQNMIDYVTMEDGKKVQLPRYFRDKIFDSSDRVKLAKARRSWGDAAYHEKVAKSGSAYQYERNNREAVKQAIAVDKQQQINKRSKI